MTGKVRARASKRVRASMAALLLAAGLCAGPAAGRMLSMATSSPGAVFHSAGTAVAQTASDRAGLPMTVQAFASPNVYLPAIDSGQIAFGVSNAGDLQLAAAGEQHFEGRQMTNLRAVAVLFPLRMAIYVREDSPIRTMADLKGARMPSGFAGQKTIRPLFDSILATGGVSAEDLNQVNVPNIVGGANAFMEGSADAFFFALGAAKVREADASVGGIRALPIDNTPENLAAIREHWPAGYLRLAEPGPAATGVVEPVFTLTHDAMIVTGASTPDEEVYALVKALHDNPDALRAAFGPFALMNPDGMLTQIDGVQWHPGAMDYYREVGQTALDGGAASDGDADAGR